MPTTSILSPPTSLFSHSSLNPTSSSSRSFKTLIPSFSQSIKHSKTSLSVRSTMAIEKETPEKERPDTFLREADDSSVSTSKSSTVRARFEKMIRDAQDRVCEAIEVADGRGKFKEDVWSRPGGGGGISRVLQDGDVWEKAGVNVSVVYGLMPPEAYRAAKGGGDSAAKAGPIPFFAAGISSVLHPKNPFAPTLHFNYRYFETDAPKDTPGAPRQWWFGGGTDLTPAYIFEEDVKHFHTQGRFMGKDFLFFRCDGKRGKNECTFEEWEAIELFTLAEYDEFKRFLGEEEENEEERKEEEEEEDEKFADKMNVLESMLCEMIKLAKVIMLPVTEMMKTNTLGRGGGRALTSLLANDWKVQKNACDKFDPSFYPRFKKWCDDYFYIKHRDERRGLGGIFFDDLNDYDQEMLLSFATECASSVVPAYIPIVERRKNTPFTDGHKEWQQLRRGRYVEFNLVYDRGTTFGLKTGGRIESILVSLPLTARWEYDHKPEEGSEEWKLLDACINPKEWI
ncbi:hypothetical protein GIB67_016086 [Kingdonia uniflora]|uniref:coproporphyrinogen oxidase n=1 Tax=Kingdonia uniflora TaxID=39325 RepID=A0A7J7L1W7_9MAGN|nr:hypothetical protein GIB67_016086 [Kingdonia uniflora]